MEDARAVAEIHVRAWCVAYQGIIPAEFLASLSVEQREAMWRNSIKNGMPDLQVARTEGRIVGFAASGPCRDAGAAPRDGEIWAIYVEPSYWSTGVGRTLWLNARERLRSQGYERASLWVLAKNARAIRFYRAAGFVEDSSSTKEANFGDRSSKEVRYQTSLSARPNAAELL